MSSNTRIALLASALLAAGPAYAAVTISTKPTVNMTCSSGVCTPTAKDAVLNVGDLANMLASGDVKVTSGQVAKDIQINGALSWTSISMLTLDSYGSIAFNKPVLVAGAGDLTITTSANGDFRFHNKGHIEFSDSHSGLVINGQAYRLMANIKDFARALRHTDGSGQFFALQKSIHSRKRYSAPPIDKQFNGTFEGLGNALLKLTISGANGTIGFFSVLGLSGTARDLRLEGANISARGKFVGTIAGSNQGTMLNCDASGQISITDPNSFAGGLVGSNDGMIAHSSASTIVNSTGNGSVVGGLVGENFFVTGSWGDIQQSYATGMVTGGDNTMAGGLVGESMAGIFDSYATGAVTGGNGASVGGLLGNDTNDNSTPTIENTYSTGAVSGGSGANVGGLIGVDLAQTGTSNSYWDLDSSGISDPAKGAGNVQNDPGITGLTTEQFKSGLPQGFDNKVWKEKAKLNNGYPYLVANPPPK